MWKVAEVFGEFFCVLNEMCQLIQFLAVLVPAKSLSVAFDCKHTIPYHLQIPDL